MKKSSAYCGLYCEACPTYIKTQNNEQTDEKCEGCRSDVLGSWCSTCHLKSCARKKGLDFCIECSDYPCQPLIDFAADKNYPYHEDVFENLEMIKEFGETKWRELMDKKYRDKDGKSIDWYEQREPK